MTSNTVEAMARAIAQEDVVKGMESLTDKMLPRYEVLAKAALAVVIDELEGGGYCDVAINKLKQGLTPTDEESEG